MRLFQSPRPPLLVLPTFVEAHSSVLEGIWQKNKWRSSPGSEKSSYDTELGFVSVQVTDVVCRCVTKDGVS